MNTYTPPTTTPNYMTGGWGVTSQQKETALKIDHIADKAAFAIEMLESALRGFDTLEKEIVDVSNAPTPPTPQTIRAFAYRIDEYQKQLEDGLARVKFMMKDIDKTTDNIQAVKTGW